MKNNEIILAVEAALNNDKFLKLFLVKFSN